MSNDNKNNTPVSPLRNGSCSVVFSIFVHDLLSIRAITKCQLYLRSEFGCQSPSLFCVTRYKAELKGSGAGGWLFNPPNSGPLCKEKLKKRPRPPDTYYLHINFEFLGTQRQAARTANGLIVSILSLSVTIHRRIIYNGEYKLP